MVGEKIYLNSRYKGERPDAYGPGKLHPIYLGDVLDNRYYVFRKLRSAFQRTVWLARDMSAPDRRFVAVKVYAAKPSENMNPLIKSLKPLTHPGQKHVEQPLDCFKVNGPNGNHLCLVVEPLGGSFYEVIDEAYDKCFGVEEPKLSSGDNHWPAGFAKRACWQILQGLDYLHQERIAHRTIEPYNICLALTYGLSQLSENEIQKPVWPGTPEELEKNQVSNTTAENSSTQDGTSSSDSDSDDSSMSEWEKDWEEFKKTHYRVLAGMRSR